jgi:phosphatidylglycerophosphatase A
MDKAAVWCATGLMVGKIPVAPGTFGTVAGIPLCLLLGSMTAPMALAALTAFVVLAVWAADRGARVLAARDPGCIVIDEMAGILVTLWGLPTDGVVLAAGFVLFRLLDVTKPFPIRRLEKLPGGLGIVADDLAAGVAANLLLRIGLAAV